MSAARGSRYRRRQRAERRPTERGCSAPNESEPGAGAPSLCSQRATRRLGPGWRRLWERPRAAAAGAGSGGWRGPARCCRAGHTCRPRAPAAGQLSGTGRAAPPAALLGSVPRPRLTAARRAAGGTGMSWWCGKQRGQPGAPLPLSAPGLRDAV